MKINFQKYQAAGNDFILLDGINNEINLEANKVARLCKRHYGIGADGLIIAKPSEKSDLFMDYYNSDGTIAEMCGNGIRSLAAFANDNGLTANSEIEIETRAGLKSIKNKNNIFSVGMGKPSYSNSDIGINGDQKVWDFPLNTKGDIKIYAVSMGNPHCIIFTDDIKNVPLNTLGPLIENHPLFKNKTNVEWVEVEGPDKLSVQVWERGVGHTLACGTGACASFAVANKLGLVKDKAIVSLPGGQLHVELHNNILLLKGDAKKVFEGSIDT